MCVAGSQSQPIVVIETTCTGFDLRLPNAHGEQVSAFDAVFCG